jgi:hypothetical protein
VSLAAHALDAVAAGWPTPSSTENVIALALTARDPAISERE